MGQATGAGRFKASINSWVVGHRGFVWDQRMVPLGIFNVYVLLGGLVVWKIWDFLMKGIFFVKGGTLIRIPNDRDPNHQFSIS